MSVHEDWEPSQHNLGTSPLDVGTRARTGEPIPHAGSWEVVDHDCPAAGSLRPLGPPDQAPPCPGCDGPTTWQLTHLATSVAADHPDGAPLP